MKAFSFKFNYYILTFFLGFFSVMPIVVIPLGNTDIAVFRLCFFSILFFLAFKLFLKQKVTIGANVGLFIKWLLAGLFSCLCGCVFFMSLASDFFANSVFSAFKVVSFLIFTFIWLGQDKDILSKANSSVLYGILAGCLINLLWSVIDGAGYYLTGESINNIIFSDYIERHNIRYGKLSLIVHGYIRSAGFNGDPAQIGFIAPLVIFYGLYNKKYSYVVLAVLGIMASMSTTAMVCSFIVFLLYWCIKANQSHLPNLLFRWSLFIVIFFIILFVIDNHYNNIITTMLEGFVQRVLYAHIEMGNNSPRLLYLLYAPFAFSNLGFLSIFGVGFGNASYGYVYDREILSIIGYSRFFAYDPENTYISYLMDTGIVGFILFIFFMFKAIRYYWKCINLCPTQIELLIFSGLAATMLSMLFYHYILFTPQMLITIVALSYMDYRMKVVISNSEHI